MLIVAGPSGASAHDGGASHPEQQGRIFSVMDGVRDLHLEGEIDYVGSPEAELGDLARVHTTKYLDELESFCREGGGDIDPDTYARLDSFAAARRAVGAGLEAIRALEGQGEGVAFVPVRPPGHHAEADRAMGFCLLNNVAVSAAMLAARGQRVLIVDWDVHHGNGTQSIFWDDPEFSTSRPINGPSFRARAELKRSEAPTPSASRSTSHCHEVRPETLFSVVLRRSLTRRSINLGRIGSWCRVVSMLTGPIPWVSSPSPQGTLHSSLASCVRLPLVQAASRCSWRAATAPEHCVRL